MRRSIVEPSWPAVRRASRHATHHRRLAAALLAPILGACTEAAAPAVAPSRWTLSSRVAAEQVRLPGEEAEVPSVVVTDSAGRVATGMFVRFTVTSGDGTVEVEDAVTNDAGRASAGRWTLGAALGLHRVRATVVDEPRTAADFRATAIPADGPLRMDARCPLPDSLLPTGWALPQTAARLARRQPLTVVAIGSSSTVGAGATTADSAYPALLASHLRRLYPASEIVVFNAGRGAQALHQLEARFGTDVAPREPHLVVLQTGTVDAINLVPLDTFETRLRHAIGALRAFGAEIVLLDSQRYPQGGESVGYQAYQAVMLRVGAEFGVPVLRRFAWMTHWLATGSYGYPQLLAGDRLHPSDLTYSCTARGLADGIAAAVRHASGR